MLAYSSIVHTSFLLAADAISSVVYMLVYLASTVFFFLFLLQQQDVEKSELLWLNSFNKNGD